jgi:hypothetical protein
MTVRAGYDSRVGVPSTTNVKTTVKDFPAQRLPRKLDESNATATAFLAFASPPSRRKLLLPSA